MKYPFKQAKHFAKASRHEIDLIVVHDMEYPERANSAEWCADFFSNPKNAKGEPIVASAHYCVDSDSIVQCVEEKDVAWHAGPVNGYSIGIEHAGYAGQTSAEWADEYSTKMLERSAELVGDLCRRYGIPIIRLKPEDLKVGKRKGICGHSDVTDGLQGGKGHWDPGPNFPWEKYLEMVRKNVEWGSEPPTEPAPGEPIAREPSFREPGVVTPEQVLSAPDFSRFVEVECAGITWLVCPIPIAPVGIEQAKKMAEALGCELPTPPLCDAIFRKSDMRVNPALMIQTHDGSAAGMNSPEIYRKTADALQNAIGDRSLGLEFTLVGGAFKDVVVQDGHLGLYGWHVDDSKEYERVLRARKIWIPTSPCATPGPERVVQPFYAGHLPSWKDYSQAVRLCRRK